MEKFKSFQLTTEQQRNVIGGFATATANCGGGKSVTCTGSVCQSTDGASGYCNCDGANGKIQFCSSHEK